MAKKEIIKNPLLLLILDGWGVGEKNDGNAIHRANTPVMDGLLKNYPNTLLHAHGQYVGLPKGECGNSEAGHMNIGAGRVVKQDMVEIDDAIIVGTFAKNTAFLEAIRNVKEKKTNMHLMGMLPGGKSPHSSVEHIKNLILLCREHGIKRIYLHLFTDGRDSPRFSSLKFVRNIKARENISDLNTSTLMGRFYAMDRKKKWDRTERAYNAMVLGKGKRAKTAEEAITLAHGNRVGDEFIEPYVCGEKEPSARIDNGDSVLFFNLRSDRARQLTKAFVQKDFNKKNPGSFKRKKVLKDLYFVAMTDFGPDLEGVVTAFPSVDLKNTLPMVLSDLKQLYIAENEKYAHVTYFFNGGYPGKVDGEISQLIPSPDVVSYDETPAMSTKDLKYAVVHDLRLSSKLGPLYKFTTLNLAAPDMVGHTGSLEAAVECCEKVDQYVGEIVDSYLKAKGTVLITADHGNVELMIDPLSKSALTQHTTNPVPFIVVDNELAKKIKLRSRASLCDIAPTVLSLLGVDQPEDMTGKSIISKGL